ncbi:MAG: hypothetical protein M3R16_06075 [Pseudomonadota bacterium]|nr:hypothetical protein [Pseudomonadota bacterium]
MQATQPAPYPLEVLWRAPALIWVLLGGEGLAVVLALAPGTSQDPWVYFGLLSLAIQWVSMLTLVGLYLMRRRLAPWGTQQLAYIALALLLANTWLVTALVWLLTGQTWAVTRGDWFSLVVRSTGIVLTVGLLSLAAFENYWRA